MDTSQKIFQFLFLSIVNAVTAAYMNHWLIESADFLNKTLEYDSKIII